MASVVSGNMLQTVKQLKSFLKSQGVDIGGCVEKSDLVRKASAVKSVSLKAVRRDIATLLNDKNHDDGNYGPLLIRFAWHNCGTYCKDTNTGGSNGSTMRFSAEANDPENSGLDKARELLKPITERYPWLTTDIHG